MLEGQTLLITSQSDNSEKMNSPLVKNYTQPSLLGSTNNNSSKSQLKYQYSFTDAIILDELSSLADFKVTRGLKNFSEKSMYFRLNSMNLKGKHKI